MHTFLYNFSIEIETWNNPFQRLFEIDFHTLKRGIETFESSDLRKIYWETLFDPCQSPPISPSIHRYETKKSTVNLPRFYHRIVQPISPVSHSWPRNTKKIKPLTHTHLVHIYILSDSWQVPSWQRGKSPANEGAKNSLLGGGRPFSKVRRVV